MLWLGGESGLEGKPPALDASTDAVDGTMVASGAPTTIVTTLTTTSTRGEVELRVCVRGGTPPFTIWQRDYRCWPR